MTEMAIAPPRPLTAVWVVLVCMLIAILEGYDIQAIGVAAPTLAPALHLSQGQVGLAGSMAMVGLVFGAVLGGWAADRVGRKPVLVAAVAWFGVFSLLTAMVSTPDLLLALRLLTGLGFGAAMPNMIAMAGEVSPPGRRVSTVTAIFIGMPIGGASVALLARFLPPAFDWRLIFLVGGAAPLLIVPVAALLLPETLVRRDAGADRRTLPALFGEDRAPTTLFLWIAFAAVQLVLQLMLAWLPLLVVGKGLGRDAGSLAALCFNLAGVGGGLAMGRSVDRFGERWPLLLGFAGLALAMGLLAVANGQILVPALAAAAGFGVIGAQFSLYAIAPRYYPAPVRATAAGAAVGAGRIGAVAGPLLAGVLRSAHASVTETLAWTLPFIATGALCVLLLTRRSAAFDD